MRRPPGPDAPGRGVWAVPWAAAVVVAAAAAALTLTVVPAAPHGDALLRPAPPPACPPLRTP